MNNEIIKKTEKFRKKISLSIRENIFDILITLCIIIFALGITPKNLQNDTFYTIKCGEYIFNNGISNLTTDPFSWIELPYTYPHWLYDLMIYSIYFKFGLDGIYISTIVFTVALGMLLYNLCTYVSKNRVVSGVVLIGAMYLLRDYITARAQLVTFICFVGEIFCVEKLLDTKKKRYGVILVLIAWLIAQLHCAVFPMFFIFLLPYIAEYVLALLWDSDLDEKLVKKFFELVVKFSKKEDVKKKFEARIVKVNQNINIRKVKREKLRNEPYKIIFNKNNAVILLLIFALIAGCSGIINPTGDNAYTYLYKTYQGNTTESINEHQPLTLLDSTDFTFALLIFIGILIFTDTKIKLPDLFMLCGLTYLSFKSRRQTSIFAIACAPILVKMISAFFAKYDKETCNKILTKATSIIGIIVIIGGFVFVEKDYIISKKDEEYIYSSDYPVEAAKWIKDNLDLSTLKLYNEYNYGSYLLYQDIPVFIDSRADLYAPEFNSDSDYEFAGEDIFSDALDIPSLSRGYEDIFEKYGVNHVILYANAKLCLLLDKDENYELLYDDDDFRVYERLNAE